MIEKDRAEVATLPIRVDRSHQVEVRGRSEPGSFEGFALEPERMKSSAQSQVVLHAKETTVAQPKALVDVALEIDLALATLGPQGDAGQDTSVANRNHLMDQPLHARK